MEFRTEDINIYDVSLVSSNPENPKLRALKSIGNSFYNNIAVLLYKLIMTTNLIIIGQVLLGNICQYELVISYQIYVIILEILGKFLIIGLVKYIFEDKEDNDEIYNSYIRMKTALVLIIPLVTTPVAILSKFIIKIFNTNLKISIETIFKNLWAFFNTLICRKNNIFI